MAEQAKWWDKDYWLALASPYVTDLWDGLVGKVGVPLASITVALVALPLLATGLLIYGWFCPDKVANWPLLPRILDRLRRKPIPKADRHRLSVLVAHLKGDKDNQVHDNILTLLAEFEGVQTLRLDRTLQGDDPDPQRANSEGHEQAKRILATSGASILIWGRIMVQGGQTVPYLLITANNMQTGGRQYGFQQAATGFDLPGILWADLANVLRLIVETRSAEAFAAEGHYQADRLRPFIRQVQTLLTHANQQPDWPAEGLASVRFALADAQQIIGEQTGDNSALLNAITNYTQVLTVWTRDRVPLSWAGTQNNLGIALQTLGERESGTAQLKQAVQAYGNALLEWTRNRVPLNWAGTQNNLGTALQALGERESGTAQLEQAVQSYENALLEYTRDRAPLSWAGTQNNLGTALQTLGERESGTKQLEQAAKAYENALIEWTRERVPLNWAATQNNLGNVLVKLGIRESGTARLEQAVKVYENALMEHTRDRVPLDWAMTQNNLGNALRTLGEREGGATRLEQAVNAYENALMERTHDRVPLDWAMTQHNLGTALQTLGERESSTKRLEQAVKAYEHALMEYTRDRAPLNWAMSFGNQGVALASLAEQRGDIGTARRALEQLQQAQALFADIGHPWASFYQARQAAAETLLQRLQAATPTSNTSPSR